MKQPPNRIGMLGDSYTNPPLDQSGVPTPRTNIRNTIQQYAASPVNPAKKNQPLHPPVYMPDDSQDYEAKLQEVNDQAMRQLK